MKIRTDFVTNSSSASYTLEIIFENDEGAAESLRIDTGEEGYIELAPTQAGGDILFSRQSMYSASNISELCDLLATSFQGNPGNVEFDEEYCEDLIFAITGKLKYYGDREELAGIIEEMGGNVSESIAEGIDYLIENDINSESSKQANEMGIPVLTEVAFIKKFDEEKFYEVLQEGGPESFSFGELEQERFFTLKAKCATQGITTENLKKISIKNKRDGWGDSATVVQWIGYMNGTIKDLLGQYGQAKDDDERNVIVNKMFEFIRSEPEMSVASNDSFVESAICVWTGSDAALRATIQEFLSGRKPLCQWMGQYCKEYVIDVTGKRVSYRAVIYYGDDAVGARTTNNYDSDDDDE